MKKSEHLCEWSNMRKADKQHLTRIAQLGCILCGRPAEIHHIRAGMGMGQRNGNDKAIGLCHYHHRTGPFGEAIHNGQKTFESRYGTERELLDKVNKELEMAK